METAVAAHRIGPDERPVLVDVFVAAFEADPWFRWRYPGHDYPARAREWFDLVAGLTWGRADAWLTDDGEAASIWIRPGRELIADDDLVRVAGLIERQHGERTAEVMEALFAGRTAEPEGAHALCLYVGVRPERQGRGLGREVMQPVLDRCDRDGTPAFLTSTNPRNVAFYERLGFRSTAVVEVAPGIEFRSMLREPAA